MKEAVKARNKAIVRMHKNGKTMRYIGAYFGVTPGGVKFIVDRELNKKLDKTKQPVLQ